MKYNKHVETIFLDSTSNNFITTENVNVILSPSLYWVKKISLPVKYLRDVKTLLPSLFEDTVNEGVYSYSAYKSGDYFFIFAYEDKKILDLLSSKGISPAQIKNVYFAQSEFSTFNHPITINETQSMYLKDELLVLIPTTWLEESFDLDIKTITLSKNNITLKQFNHIVNDKSLYTIAGIFILLIVVVGVEYIIAQQKLNETSNMRDELFITHSLKPTMMQNRSMLKEYKKTHTRQIKIRENISYMLSLNLKKTVNIALITLKSNKLIFEFSGIKKGREVILEKDFKANDIHYTSNFKSESWYVEITL